jgi:hypothetical protein
LINVLIKVRHHGQIIIKVVVLNGILNIIIYWINQVLSHIH